MASNQPRGKGKLSEHFFHREEDGSVRLRLRLPPELATLIEDAAGDTPLMLYIPRALRSQSEYTLKRRTEDDEKEAREAQSNGHTPEQ